MPNSVFESLAIPDDRIERRERRRHGRRDLAARRSLRERRVVGVDVRRLGDLLDLGANELAVVGERFEQVGRAGLRRPEVVGQPARGRDAERAGCPNRLLASDLFDRRRLSSDQSGSSRSRRS